MPSRIMTAVIYLVSGAIGVVAFAYPFILPTLGPASAEGPIDAAAAHQLDAPLFTFLMLTLCLVVLLLEVQGQAVSAKQIAALGVMTAIVAALRFIEVVVSIPGGFSPIFAPMIIAGYVFGSRFGFLMGTIGMLVSALATGNVGPWLPYQMFAAGWMGLSAGWLPGLRSDWLKVGMLALFSFGWGLLFGAVMNLYFWPFVAGNEATSWQHGIGLAGGLRRYLGFYLATSFLWDLSRAFGNAAFVVIMGAPTIRALARFRSRFHFQIVGVPTS